ncbi:hypothetical protein D9M68_708260 [compost metagenome]
MALRLVADAVRLAVVEVQLEVVEAGDVEVEARAEQVVLHAVLAALVGGGEQHVLDRAERQVGAADLAERQARGNLAVVGVAAGQAVVLALVVDLVDEDEQVAEAPAAGVLEGPGLLGRRIDGEILAPEEGQAVVLPLQQVAGRGLAADK